MTDDLAPSGALRVDITKHKRSPGTRYPLQLSVAAFDDIGLPSVDVEATQVDVDLELEMIGSQLSATGTISAQWEGPCRRCVDPMTGTSETTILEIFELEPVEGETYLRERDFVDLRPMIKETVMLSLPVVPLCREDCEGPAPERFGPLATADDAPAGDGATPPAEPQSEPVDPRWAGLSDLTFSDASPENAEE